MVPVISRAPRLFAAPGRTTFIVAEDLPPAYVSVDICHPPPKLDDGCGPGVSKVLMMPTASLTGPSVCDAANTPAAMQSEPRPISHI